MLRHRVRAKVDIFAIKYHYFTGCSNSNEPIEFEDETQTIDLAEYEEVVYKNRSFYLIGRMLCKMLKKKEQGLQVWKKLNALRH